MGALKAARRYAYNEKNRADIRFIAMGKIRSTGRSFGAVSVTGHTAYREPFEPCSREFLLQNSIIWTV